MNPTSRNLTPVLAGLVLLSLIVAVSPPILSVSAAQGEPTGPSLHRLHLGYDKATGQQVDDLSARALASSTAAEEAEVEAFFARKRERVDPSRITFRSGITIHPGPGMEAGAREVLAAPIDPGSGGFWLIQFRYPFPTETRYRLEDAGVAFYDYMDVAGFYAKVPPEAAPLLENMLQEGEVRYVGGIPAGARIRPGLAAQAVRNPAAEREIVVLTFDEPTPAQLEELGRWMAIEQRSTGPIHIVEGRASGGSILALANLDYVRWVEEKSEATLGNLDGGMGVGADVVRYSGFDGTGVQVMVVDSGIARDSDTYHPDLQGDRILDQWDYQDSDDDATDDYVLGNGHGTHVAGTIGGRYDSIDPNSNRSHQGVAPDASFLIYRLFGPAGFSEVSFNEALGRATSVGNPAHVSNNSWGGSISNDYTSYTEMADAAVRGEYNGQPVNMITISHNYNRLTTAPGTGKNVITVGAVKDGNSPAGTLVWNSSCGTQDLDYNWPPGERVCYSNYGPIDTDGDLHTRVKPDLMAPGAMISSAVPWYSPFDSNYYLSLHGTSHAAPHVSGAIAQLLDAYSDVGGGWLFEWPEMVKAMLLASAVDVGGDTDNYGHGLLAAYHAIYAEPGVDEPMDLWSNSVSTTGETRDFTFEVPAGYQEVRVVLTWADPPGATEVINDLDVFWVKDGGGSQRGSAILLDDTVEYVRIPADFTPGTWTIRVRATSVADSPQAFALAAHVLLAEADLSVRAKPSSSPGAVPSFGPGGEFYLHQYVSNSGYTAGGSYARLHAPEGFTVMGVTVYTQDGYEHRYDASELYHDPVEDDYYVALGETLAGFERHVRWFIDIDGGTECGSYPFESTAYWLEAGSQQASRTVNTQVPVTCHYVYLPLVMRGN